MMNHPLNLKQYGPYPGEGVTLAPNDTKDKALLYYLMLFQKFLAASSLPVNN